MMRPRFQAAFLRSRCIKTRCFSLASFPKNEEKHLALFPEFQRAKEQHKLGNLTQAISSLYRVYEILQNSLGTDAPLTNSIRFHLAGLTRANGDSYGAIKLITTHTSDHLKTRVGSHVFLASIYLLQCSIVESHEHAQKAVNLCEQEQDRSNPDNTLFSSAYASLGTLVPRVVPNT
jgi:hypothetical protein